MSPEEKIEAAQKLIDEARAEIAAKKRNWPEKIEPGMLFRCPIGTFLIRYRSHGPLGPVNDWDLVEIFTGRYLSGEGGKFSGQEHEFTYLGHARDLIKIADDAHEPTGAELVGRYCEYCDTDGDWDNWEKGECKDFTPGADQPYLRKQGVRFRFARLAR